MPIHGEMASYLCVFTHSMCGSIVQHAVEDTTVYDRYRRQ